MEKEKLYMFIDNIIYKAINYDKMKGKYAKFKDLDFELLFTLKPLLKYFSQEDLQGYCKWLKYQGKTLVRHNEYWDMYYRGYKIKYNTLISSIKYGLQASIYDTNDKYLYKTAPKYMELLLVKEDEEHCKIHRIIPNYCHTRKLLKIEIDKIIKSIK